MLFRSGRNKFPVEEEEVTDEIAGESLTTSTAKTQMGPINSRDAAFHQLNIISEFFKKTEPHSPISYILAKAVKWGNMPLNELIGELIPDNSSREYYSSLTGVKTTDEI